MHKELYRIPIDGEWDLTDLTSFPRLYQQLYSAIYSFEGHFSPSKNEEIREIFRRHPWNGGFSTVNWFSDLYNVIPHKDRPEILSMKYASQGWIDLGLCVSAAASLKIMLVALSSTVRHINETYNQIQKGINERKLNRIKLRRAELKLDTDDIDFIEKSCETMANLMGFKHLKVMHKRTESPFVSLKMLLSMYRRLTELKQFEDYGKTLIGNKKNKKNELE